MLNVTQGQGKVARFKKNISSKVLVCFEIFFMQLTTSY